MKRFILYFLLFPEIIVAQQFNVKGYVIDNQAKDVLVGAYVLEKDTYNGCITDSDGFFSFAVSTDTATIAVSYIGYDTVLIKVNRLGDLGQIGLRQNSIELGNVTVTAQTGIERKTPVALTLLTAKHIEANLGTQEFPEILKNVPSVHANKQGGGYGDSEIWMRGFDNSNIAVLINGVTVNDMESGVIYWSNWTCLSDVTSKIQVQRGIGASKVSSHSVGGTISITTHGRKVEKGGSAYYMVGNDGYNKILFTANSGMTENGWSLNLLGSKTWGDGYVQGTNFEGYSYFANISKRINKNHQISFVAFDSPQKHYMRSYALSQAEWNKIKKIYNGEEDWTRFNPDYGFDNAGQRKSTDYNVYNKPQVIINHNWMINEKSFLSSSIYGSWGRGYGYSGDANSDVYTSEDWYPTDNGILNEYFRTAANTFDYDKIYQINANSANGSEMIMSQKTNDHDWYGFVSTYNNSLSECLDLNVGIDSRYYKGIHTNKIVDLYGGDYYIDPSREDVNVADNANAANESWVNQKLSVGDVIYRDYDSYIVQEGLFTQLEYSKNRLSAFLSGAINANSYWRYDRLYYDEDHAKSETKNFVSGNAKAGINFNINSNNNVFLNGGYVSQAPQFKSGVFMSATTSNAMNKDAKNQKASLLEIGYGYKNRYINIKVDGYYTKWIDKTMIKTGKLANNDSYYMNMVGVNALHVGLEFELESKPLKWLETAATLSVGDWTWDSDNVRGYAYNVYGQAVTTNGSITTPEADDHAWAVINTKGIHVGGSAQTTASLNVMFVPFKDFKIGGTYTVYDRNYAYYSFSGGNLSLGEELKISEPWQIPTSEFLDLRLSYQLPLDAVKVTLYGQINNVFDSKNIEKAWNPSNISTEEIEVDPDDVVVFYSFGRTWSLKMRIEF